MQWILWLGVGLGLWLVIAVVAGSLIGHVIEFGQRPRVSRGQAGDTRTVPFELQPSSEPRRKVLVVDDDVALRVLLRTTLGADRYLVEEASSAEEALAVARSFEPAVAVVDVALPGEDGLSLCVRLKELDERLTVIVLTGVELSEEEAIAHGADELLRKPFSPPALLGAVDAGRLRIARLQPDVDIADAPLLRAQEYDLDRLLDFERAQRRLLQDTYRQTVTTLAAALESKDPGTDGHAARVQQYALEITAGVDPALLRDETLAYGFLLHDVGNLAIPARILNKPGPLTDSEQLVMQRHPVVGAEMLRDVVLLHGAGLNVVRYHHERWDGRGYPDGLAGATIPLSARVFAVADALDALTSDRPYRKARSWEEAVSEIVGCAGTHFDPAVVDAVTAHDSNLHLIRDAFAAVA